MFRHSDQFDFCVREPLCEQNFLCIFVLGITSGRRVKFVEVDLPNPFPVVYASDRPKAVVQVLFLFCVALWFILRGASLLFVLVFLPSFKHCYFLA